MRYKIQYLDEIVLPPKLWEKECQRHVNSKYVLFWVMPKLISAYHTFLKTLQNKKIFLIRNTWGKFPPLGITKIKLFFLDDDIHKEVL